MNNINYIKRIMGRGNISLAVCVLLITTALSATTATSFETVSSTEESISYSFLFTEPNFQTVEADDSYYTNINMPGCMAIGRQAGEPSLPVKFIKLLLPPMKTVTDVTVVGNPVEIDLGSIDLKQKPVFPYQNPVPIGSTEPQEFKIDTALYASDALYPSAIHEGYHIGYSRGYAILDLALNPVQYIPDEGRLFLYAKMTVTIDFEETQEVNQFFRNSQNDKEWVETLVYNPEVTDFYTVNIPTFDYPGGLCDPSDDYEYVIITTTYNGLDYWSTGGSTPYNWESLMDKHESDDGLSCTIVTIQDIDACSDYHSTNPLFNDQEAHIREFCKDAYEDWGTDYIFVGGDDEWIPARHMDTSYETNIDSDIYWSNLDSTFNEDEDNYWGEAGDGGFDLYAEIFIGRITCDEPQDVSNWMTKSFYYADNADMDYLGNAAFYGGNTGWNCQGDDFMDFSAIKGTDDWLGPDPHHDGPWPTWLGFLYGFETWNDENSGTLEYNLSAMWTAEPPNPGWQGGSEAAAINGLKTDINNDQVTLISGIAHANAMMSLDVSSSTWESQYHNTKPFFIHDYGCHCGDMDAAADGILHSMLFHSDTELAFACVYNTCYGWGNFDCTNSSSALQQKLFWDYFFDTTHNSGSPSNWQLGKAHAWSKDVMAPTINWEPSYGTWRAVIQGCLLFADPAQKIKTPRTNDPPAKPDQPSGPSAGSVGIEHTFSSSTTDPDDDQVFYKWDWGDGILSDWLGPYNSGDVVSANHSWIDGGDYAIKVQARDLYGLKSEWSDQSSIHIGVPVINIGEITGGFSKVSFIIKNVGDADATDVYWTITIKGGLAGKIGLQYWGDILLLNMGDEQTLSPLKSIFGLGRVTITVDASAPYTETVTETVNGFLLGFFVIILP